MHVVVVINNEFSSIQAPFANDDTIPFGEEDQIQAGKLP